MSRIPIAVPARWVAALAALVGSGLLLGQAPPGPPPCSVASLVGGYGGIGTGTNVASPHVPVGPFAVVNRVVFDARGRLTVPVETWSFNGEIGRLAAPVTATYTVEPNCTGTLVFDSADSDGAPTRFDIVLVDGGREVIAIHAEPGFVHTTVLKRQ